jgi:hypothetical protein
VVTRVMRVEHSLVLVPLVKIPMFDVDVGHRHTRRATREVELSSFRRVSRATCVEGLSCAVELRRREYAVMYCRVCAIELEPGM